MRRQRMTKPPRTASSWTSLTRRPALLPCTCGRAAAAIMATSALALTRSNPKLGNGGYRVSRKLPTGSDEGSKMKAEDLNWVIESEILVIRGKDDDDQKYEVTEIGGPRKVTIS